MKQAVVLFWSMTGNTAAMAQAVAEGGQNAGLDVRLCQVSEITPQEALSFDVLAMGCPAMGAEVLEEGEFEPFFTQLESGLHGKTVALFGSYDWGDGQWMRDWAERTQADGARLVGGEGLIVHGTPDEDGLAQCRQLGAALAN
ncbi:MAG TPA: flavodoxin [Clostridiales bacterium]|nr:flavodoxin [Clostridiales bacterium]